MYIPVSTALICALALIHLLLSARVISLRYAARVSLGDGGDPRLMRAMRGHGNLVEYAPIFVLLVLVGEIQGLPVWLLAGLAIVFTLGRAMHAICFALLRSSMALRAGGMLLTLASMLLMLLADAMLLL